MVHIAKIGETFLDFPNAEDIAVIIFTTGCSHGCPGCHSPQLQNHSEDDLVLTREEAYQALKDRCKRNNTDKIVFSGGDPLYHKDNPDQMIDLINIMSQLQSEGYSCCMYTGYYYNQVIDLYKQYLVDYHPDFIKCGEYEEGKKEKEWGKTDNSFTLATSNQYFMKKISENPINYVQIGVKNKFIF